MDNQALRVLHFSDIHIGLQLRHMHWKKWFSKRAVGAINLLRGRGQFFDDAVLKMEALSQFMEQQAIDLVINTGDYTALGLKKELILARRAVAPLMAAPYGYVTVPGNHDIYVSEATSHMRFSEVFGEVLQSDMPDYCCDGVWPLARLIHHNIAVIAVNSSRPNPWPWRSNGKIPPDQLIALANILKDHRLRDRFIFVVTHYAPRLANGEDDTFLHGLTNAEEFILACRQIDRGAILCGHVHDTYHVRRRDKVPDIYCAGSAVMEGREGFWLYELQRESLEAIRGYWNAAESKYHVAGA